MLNFTNAVGNIMNRLGKCGAIVKNARTNQLIQQTAQADPGTGLVGQLNSEPDIQAVVGNSYIGTLSGPESPPQLAQQVAQSIVDRMVFRDNPQPGQTLTTTNIPASITEFIRQMKAQSQTILAMTVGFSITAESSPGPHFNGAGNAIIVISTKRPSDGVVLENSFAETLQFTCTADSFNGGQVAFNEQYSITGQGSVGDVFAFNWPAGSGASAQLNAVDGDTSNGSNNILTNSNFSTYVNVANVPDNWTLDVGVAGTNIAQNTGITYSGGSSLQLIGDGTTGVGTLTQLTQLLNNSAGSSGTLASATQYSHCIFARRDGIAATNGQWQISLVDGNGNIIKDNAGNNNSYTIDLTALGTSFTQFVGTFRTPTIMPPVYGIRMQLTTGNALTSGRSVYFGKSSLGLMTQLYTSGPFINIHAGNIAAQQGDAASANITNSYGAGGTLSTWQVLANQLLSLQQNDQLLPSSATPTISDGLIA